MRLALFLLASRFKKKKTWVQINFGGLNTQVSRDIPKRANRLQVFRAVVLLVNLGSR